MQESFENALIEALSDIHLYGLCIFLPCLLALIFTVMHKKDRRKKIWKMLLAFVPLVIVYKTIIFDSVFDNTCFEVFVVFAIFYALAVIIGIAFWKKKIIIALAIPFLLCSSYATYATYKYFDSRQPSGRIENYTLPSHVKSNDDYAVKITYTSATGDNLYSMTIRGKRSADSLASDSISYCLLHGQKRKLKDLQGAQKINCQWKFMSDEKKQDFLSFKKLAENYKAELDCEKTCNNYEFNIDIIDYNKRTFRTLELGHASMHIPAAQEIFNIGLKLIMSSRESE